MRNKISYTSKKFDFLSLNPEVTGLIKFTKNIVLNQYKSAKDISPTQGNILQDMMEPLLPMGAYLFLLYRNFLPYLTVLDHSYSIWKELTKENI